MDKPNCYQCKWRGTLPGDAHSCCRHSSNAEILSNPLAQIFGLMASIGRTSPLQVESKLKVKGNPHGIKMGWFNWPVNFDPVWLLECDGFEAKEEEIEK